jgi:hypothetical protein
MTGGMKALYYCTAIEIHIMKGKKKHLDDPPKKLKMQTRALTTVLHRVCCSHLMSQPAVSARILLISIASAYLIGQVNKLARFSGAKSIQRRLLREH